MKRLHFSIWLFLVFCFTGNLLKAQGDGPRSSLLAPVGVWGINAKYLNLNQNIIPAGTIFIPGAEVTVDVFPTTLFHTFSLGGRFAQVYAMINPGRASASALDVPPEYQDLKLSADGFSDGLVAFKLGIKGAPALNVLEFAKSDMQFSLFFDARVWYSGTYSGDELFNLGTNRLTFQLGMPMAIPLNNNRARASWLEIAPAIQLFTANEDPARGNSSQIVEQAPLFIVENHFTHNFTPKLWISVNARMQFGGRTIADGQLDTNKVSAIGGGAGVGYQILPPLGLSADYGGILLGDNGVRARMFRVSVVFTYVNLKKLQIPGAN